MQLSCVTDIGQGETHINYGILYTQKEKTKISWVGIDPSSGV